MALAGVVGGVSADLHVEAGEYGIPGAGIVREFHGLTLDMHPPVLPGFPFSTP